MAAERVVEKMREMETNSGLSGFAQQKIDDVVIVNWRFRLFKTKQ